jgi:hypothetical protein
VLKKAFDSYYPRPSVFIQTMAEIQKPAILGHHIRHGAAILHKLAMSAVKKSAMAGI